MGMVQGPPEHQPTAWKSLAGAFGLVSLLCAAIPLAGAVSIPLRVAAAAPSISISGNHFVDSGGNTVALRGVNRSGSEYMCTGGGSLVFDGPSDDASVAAMASWDINVVRVPLNEDCWLGINGFPASMSAAAYRTAIVSYINLLHAHGLYAILELHWNAPGTQQATGQQVMVDADHGPAFWTSVATTFLSDHMVIFDLYNEPQGISWACWRDGCNAGFQTVGMTSLITTVRATGATQPIMAGGNGYAGDLSQWLAFKPSDPLNQLAASLHTYDFVGNCNALSCASTLLGITAAGIPVVTGELGETDCAHGYIDAYMPWADANGIGYLGWAWNTNACNSFPSLISDYTGTPTNFGIGFKNHLLSLAGTHPTVTAISPGSGSSAGGSSVRITGTNLTGASAVTFGSTAAAAYTVNGATQITATSPAGTGTVDVSVTTTGGISASSSADQFTYVATPTVTSISPTSGPAAGGTPVTLTGTNLTGATTVRFGATAAATFTVNSATQISATSPGGTGTVDVTVTTPAGTTATSSADRFAYNGLPSVSSVTPSAGPAAGGASVTITGTNFAGVSAVSFGAAAATAYTVTSATQISATSPTGSGTVDVTVTAAGGTTATSSADHFTYVASPAVSSVSPNGGPASGGTAVTITGTNLGGATAVRFGAAAAAAFTVNSPTQITATSPAGSGTVDVTVTTAGGTSATGSADQYTFVPAPGVTSVSPSSGLSAGGTSVTITGTNLGGATAVRFGATAAASFTVNSATQITATSPAGSGMVDVTVTTAGGTSATALADRFTYNGPPAITGVAPSVGGTAGGTSVTITGTNFTGVSAVSFGGTAAAAYTVNSSTQITATSPAGTGTVDITVAAAGGTSATGAADRFTYAPPPTTTGTAFATIEGQAFSGEVASFAGGACPCTATISWGDGSSTAGAVASGHVTGTHTYAEEGSVTVTVTVHDSGGAAGAATFGITVPDAALAGNGVFAGADQGLAFTLTAATFSDGDPGGSPSDYTATINWGDGSSSAGTVSGGNLTGTHTYAASGSMTTTITIHDAGGSSVVLTGGITVVAAPSVTSTAVTATEGQVFSGGVASFTGGACPCSAVVSWGDGTSSPGTIVGGNVTGAHIYAEEGTFTVGVTVTDSVGNNSTATASATVADAALSGSGATAAADQGVAFSGVVANFSDADPGGLAADYTATINWGDGTSGTGTVSGGHVTGTHTYAGSGVMTTTVTIHDAGGSNTIANGTINVGQAPTVTVVPINAVEGQAFGGAVAHFSGGACACTATIEWGDGTTTAGTVSGGDVTGTHVYAEEGAATLKVTVTDTPGAAGNNSAGATIADAALSSTALSGAADQGIAFTRIVATFTDADPGGLTSDYSAIITWGDGTSSPGAVVSGNVSGTHNYAGAGAMAVTVTISDAGGASTIAGGTITVGAAPSVVPSLVGAGEGHAFSGTVATFTGGACTCTATVDWGDGTTTAGAVSGGSVSGTHTYIEEGPQTLKVTVTDSLGGTGSATFAANVADGALTGSGLTASASQGTGFTAAVASFSDADPGGLASDFTATISWGDGTAVATGTVAASTGSFIVTGTHTFATSGSQTTTVTISDAGGATTSVSGTISVVAAPGVTVAQIRATEGMAFNGTVATFTGGACACTATIAWGDGTTTGGNVAGAIVTASHTYAEEGAPAVSVTVTDIRGAAGTGSTAATIADAALSGAGLTAAADQGIAFAGGVATFTDPDAAGVASDYVATIDWGDGSGATAGIITAGGVTGSHTYSASGAMTTIVKVTDAGGATTTLTGTITVGAAPAVTANAFSGSEGQASGGILATFTGGSCPCTSTVDWGDGSTSTASAAGGQVTGTHVFGEEGSDTVKVTVIDSAGGSSAGSSIATTADSALSGTGTSPAADLGVTFTGVVATFTDADAGRTAGDYVATIDWGDGNSTAGSIAASGGGFSVSGSHAFTALGSARTSITVRDSGGASITLAGDVRVAPALAVGGGTFSGTEGKAFTATVASVSGGACPCAATIAWGDGAVTTGTILGGAVTGRHTYVDPGARTATVTVSDALGVHATANATGDIADPDLVVTVSTFAPTAGSSFSGRVAMVSDPGVQESPAGYLATIDWGDGSSSTGTIDEQAGGFAVDGSHAYATQATVTVKVTAREVDRNSGTSGTGPVTVAADPVPPAAHGPAAGHRSVTSSPSLPLGLPLPGVVAILVAVLGGLAFLGLRLVRAH